MDLFTTQFTTTIDPRFGPTVRGTLLNASRRPIKRAITFALVIAMGSCGLRLIAPSIDLATAISASALGCVAVYGFGLVALYYIVRREARRRYGALPATVHVRLVETGFELEYPGQAPRTATFGFVNNWWLEASNLVIVLGRRPVERCAIAIDTTSVDDSTCEWLLGHLRARV
jgi:hypothetical protein